MNSVTGENETPLRSAAESPWIWLRVKWTEAFQHAEGFKLFKHTLLNYTVWMLGFWRSESFFFLINTSCLLSFHCYFQQERGIICNFSNYTRSVHQAFICKIPPPHTHTPSPIPTYHYHQLILLRNKGPIINNNNNNNRII